MERSSLRPGWLILIVALGVLILKGFVVDLAVVDGSSMLPLLRRGQVVVVFRAAYGLRPPFGLGKSGYLFRWASPRVGDIVVARSPRTGKAIVKRVAFPSDAGAVFLLGDNPPESVDSREYGAVPVEELAGKVLLWFGSAESQ